MDDWKLITIKYSNKCCLCQEDIPQGSKELWKKGEGVKHQSCGETKLNDKRLMKTDWHDSKIYKYNQLDTIKNCQFCGIILPKGDSFINLDLRCCNKCFGIY